MEQNNINETQVVKVKAEEIETLPELGFVDEDNTMVLDTETGTVGVDKETGVVAVAGDGVSIEELAIVSELVKNGIAETVSADGVDAETVKSEMQGNDDNNIEE
ncbi:MAG: hypothetical protein IKA31_02730 [Clostridia bacterium]|nr:hypothetical protein [Clostridia bacterium]